MRFKTLTRIVLFSCIAFESQFFFFFLLIGLSFNACYSKCREQFLVNSDSTLKAQLIEFRDHKLITSKKVSPVLCKLDSLSMPHFQF